MMIKLISAGFGGQGALAIGKNLVEAGMREGLEVTWTPSYGPEMRGGTANCSVVLSEKRIGSPVFSSPTDLIALNLPSLNKFAGKVKPGGNIFINSSTVSEKVERSDVNVYYVPCGEIADKVGNPKAVNMVMLGAYIGVSEAVKVETVETIIREMFAGAKEKYIPANIAAFQSGIDFVKQYE
ncbi:MAG: 2-oxoacid:ferredoxin oxidoreductase subunit gamma [Clostridiales bacterium]|nr:2-oxoacid:ferredoxin oxidoreductase subunit gamma [Clostridiales bacterium]